MSKVACIPYNPFLVRVARATVGVSTSRLNSMNVLASGMAYPTASQPSAPRAATRSWFTLYWKHTSQYSHYFRRFSMSWHLACAVPHSRMYSRYFWTAHLAPNACAWSRPTGYTLDGMRCRSEPPCHCPDEPGLAPQRRVGGPAQ